MHIYNDRLTLGDNALRSLWLTHVVRAIASRTQPYSPPEGATDIDVARDFLRARGWKLDHAAIDDGPGSRFVAIAHSPTHVRGLCHAYSRSRERAVMLATLLALGLLEGNTRQR